MILPDIKLVNNMPEAILIVPQIILKGTFA